MQVMLVVVAAATDRLALDVGGQERVSMSEISVPLSSRGQSSRPCMDRTRAGRRAEVHME
jgi:hypothetical protein